MEKRNHGDYSPRSSLSSTGDTVSKHQVSYSDDMQPDLETQAEPKQELQQQPELTPSSSKVSLFLTMYFIANISLTLYNKQVLGSFAFPWILTAVHSGLAGLGSYAMLLLGYFELTTLSSRQHLVLFMFSLLFTLNIAMSNVSLEMVSIPFHQVMRATCPIFTILIYRVFYSRRYALAIYASIVPVIIGVGLATYGDYHFSILGFTLTLIGVVLAAIKTVVTNRLMTGGLRLGVLEVLFRMGPLAAVQSLIYSMLTGEFSKFILYVTADNLTAGSLLTVGGNGVLAFALNIISFQTNKLAGALSMTICANLKQCFTITLGTLLWDVPLTMINKGGILLAIIGAAWYSSLELKNR